MNFSTHTDGELLEAMRQNDHAAFAELFKRHYAKVHEMAYRRVRSLDVTREIVQDLFVSLWIRRETLSIDHLPSYLYTAVRNRVLNYLASEETLRKHWDYYRQFISDHAELTQHDVELSELMEVLENGLDRLPEKSKRIFRLSLLEGRSVGEIADTLNLSEKAIRYHLTQSTKKLRLHLKDHILTLIVLGNLVT